MRAKIKGNSSNSFTEFEIKLIVENIEEARLLYHIFNNSRIREAIMTKNYSPINYNAGIAQNVSKSGLNSKIRKEIESQGFEL